MMKKIPWKKIAIVFTVMLVIPVIAIAMATTAEPDEDATDGNGNIKITADEKTPDAASAATSVLTSGALGYLDGATSATENAANNDGQSNGNTDAVSSATGDPGATGSLSDDDEDEEDEDNDEDEEDDD